MHGACGSISTKHAVDVPPVVGSRRAPVYLLPSVCPHIVYEDGVGARLKRELEGVAQAQSPDRTVFARGTGIEWVARRDGAILVSAQYLAKQVLEGLRVPSDVIAGGDVELAVLAEIQRPAHVVGVVLIV
jgi:hypothetical protein